MNRRLDALVRRRLPVRWLVSPIVVLAVALGAVRPALASQAPAAAPQWRACVERAAQHHGVNADVLFAIAWQESRWNAAAVRQNTNGSVDRGPFQINSVHLARLGLYGIDAEDLHDPCTSAFIAAWLYAQHVQVLGHNWLAVGAYHSRTPHHQTRYARGIAQVLARWGVIPATAEAPGRPRAATAGGGTR